MVPSGRIPQAKPGRSRILYRRPVPRQGDRVEQKPKKKSEVLYDRSRSGRPYPIPEADTPAGGSGGAEAKEKKSEVLYDRSRSGRPYLLRQAPCPKASHFPLALYPITWQEGIQREKVWSCPVRQDRAVHRRSEACMAGAQLASLPWLTVDLSGFPPPLPPPFPIWMFLNTC